MPDGELQLGIDVGPTNTDVVAMDRYGRLLAKTRIPTSGSLGKDVAAAIGRLASKPGVERGRITRAMLGTRLARDALVARQGLRRVAVVRIGGPLTLSVPPLTTWPEELRSGVSAGETVIGGGADYDGRSAAPLDRDALARFLARLDDVDGVAVTSVFSPVAPEQELEAAALVRESLGPSVHVSLSHEIGTIGLLERENATVLNAALTVIPERIAAGLRKAFEAEGIEAEAYLSQNDGTVMTLDYALRLPVLMIGGGQANAMRGAAHLSGVDDAVVIDAGSDVVEVGTLVRGFPRELPPPAAIAGVRVSCRMPDSVGLAFGGQTTESQLEALAHAIEGARAGPAPAPVVVVGVADDGVPDGLPGVIELIRPADRDMAGAIGAATAGVSGEADRICANQPDEWKAALADARAAAFSNAVRAGADPHAVEIVSVEEVPLTYLVDPAIRIHVKAAGPAM